MRKEQFKVYLQKAQAKMQSLTALRNMKIIDKVRQRATAVCGHLAGVAKQGTEYVASFAVSLFQMVRSISKRARYTALATVLMLALITSTSVYAYIGSFTYVVYLDGEEIGYVTEAAVVDEYVAELQADESRARRAEVASVQEVTVTREQRKGIEENAEALKEQLRTKLQFKQYAYTIFINEKPVLTVGTIAEYEEVMEALKTEYASGKDNTVIQAIVLNDNVEARMSLVDANEIYEVAEAVAILRHGSNKREVYLVSRGDSLWSIARSNNLSVSEIKSANPHLDESDRLMPGDEINLVVSEPMVTVSVTKDVVVTERIPFETQYKDDSSLYKGQTKVLQSGVYGVKEITYRVTQQNGRDVSRQVLTENVTKQPRTKIVARGTKAIPAGTVIGSGQFLWPVAGRGTITSRYGYRAGGFHRGVDIGTPTGTPILAADSGTVIQSGWSGAYGILVTIDHGNGFVTKYAHNSATLVSVGQKVRRGQQIARSGSTGNSTGPHLHFEIIKNGSHVNPLSYL